MSSLLPDFLASGTPARLFPVVADARREERTLSILLAVLQQVPHLYREILAGIDVRTGKRTRVSSFTEIGLVTDTEKSGRPDGFLLVETGRSRWSALIEAKVGRSPLDPDQVERYLKLARDNEIDAVITISNDFVARPAYSPVAGSIPRLRQLTGKVSLYHWSWAYLATCCEVLAYQGVQESPEQDFLVKQLSDYLAHPSTGVERFTQMGAEWRNIVQLISSGAPLVRNTPGVEDVVASWFAEERDLCLHMTSNINRPVAVQIERKHAADQKLRLEAGVAALVGTHSLKSVLRVPDCASDITIRADLARRTWLRFDQHAVGKGFCIGGEAEERAESSVAGFAAVEAKDELIEIGLQMLATQPVVDASRPSFEVGEDLVDPRQDEVSGGLPDDMDIVAIGGDRSVAGPAVGFRDGVGIGGGFDEVSEVGGAVGGDFGQPQAAWDVSVPEFDGADDEHLAVVAASLPSGGRIVFGPEWKAGLVDFHQARQRVALGVDHAGAQLVGEQPSAAVRADTELFLELQGRDAVGRSPSQWR